MEKALEVLGNNDYVSNPRKRAAELGLRINNDGKFNHFGDYMHAKVQKLINQTNPVSQNSGIFNGISFFINGNTMPPAYELRDLIVKNGGQYHHYFLLGKTTYQIAEVLANTKVERLRKDDIILKPSFITDCVQEKKLLPIENYFLIKKNNDSTSTGAAVKQFFNRSRLHLISTMATEFKKYVAELKENESTHEFISKKKLEHLKSSTEVEDTSIVCHIDMDCFFVSVALITRPDLKGKPVAITHSAASSGSNGEISSCSYEARKKGVFARQWVKDALKTCPDLICLPYQFDDYVKTAKQLYSIIARYTLKIKAVSCDELYFDLGSICKEMNISDPLKVISLIREEIENETQCTASAGVGSNWLSARLATKKAKPNGQYYLIPDDFSNYIKDISISDLPTIGYNSLETIQNKLGKNITKCGQLMVYKVDELRKILGITNGEKVYRALRGKCDNIDFNEVIDQKSVSVNVNFGVRLKTEKDLSDMLFSLSTELSDRLNQINKFGIHLTLKYLIRQTNAPLEPEKYGAHGSVYPLRKSGNLKKPTSDEKEIYQFVMKLNDELKPIITDIRGVALHMNKLNKVHETLSGKNHGNGKTLWDFMNVNVKSEKLKKNDNGETPKFVWAPPPKETIKKAKEMKKNKYNDEDDSEWRMKISDVINIVKKRYVPKQIEKGILPPKPKREKIDNTSALIVDNETLNLGGILINYKKPPIQEIYKSFMTYLRKCVRGLRIDVINKMFCVLERHLKIENGNKDWNPLIEKSKRYLNWYCYNHHQRKIFPGLEKNEQQEEEVFQQFLEDVKIEFDTKKEEEKEKLPELICDGFVRKKKSKNAKKVLDPDNYTIVQSFKKSEKRNKQLILPNTSRPPSSSSTATTKSLTSNKHITNTRNIQKKIKNSSSTKSSGITKGQQIIQFMKPPVKRKKSSEIQCITIDNTQTQTITLD